MDKASLLRAEGVSKDYDGVQALKDAYFELRAGEVHAIVGENGAGKSTLIKIITGAVTPDEGEIFLNDQPLTDNTPAFSKSLGMLRSISSLLCFPS